MTATLFPACALPGCTIPVATPGDCCDGCRSAFGSMLRPVDSDRTPEQISAEYAERDAGVRAAYTAQARIANQSGDESR